MVIVKKRTADVSNNGLVVSMKYIIFFVLITKISAYKLLRNMVKPRDLDVFLTDEVFSFDEEFGGPMTLAEYLEKRPDDYQPSRIEKS